MCDSPRDRSRATSCVLDAIQSERDAVDALLRYEGNDYDAIVEMIRNAKGRLIFLGVGKSGHIGKKLAATFASTGTPSFFVHGTEALHGDLGMITADDVVCLISNSGTTREVLDTLPALQKLGCRRIALTANPESPLAAACDLALTYPKPAEADHLGLAPTASSTVTLVLGDAIACAVSAARSFTREEFHRCHPAGALGKQLSEGR